ncbi:hypothetical protein [Papillibacter cinnamivorans]|uniref:TFIIB-type zinc ribbon-containing protein n=1 Tax=Papillibacter cinnamivorans DSM 12816 TaxID=1122930 RepID=A0A1W2AMX5_9FIRM|nr:hypothetical protein [Papillibacter cinnamivorans]SMC61872.1 hypothetical protein SAMN02745168_1836 [Papillibacter cinnamivorans DSM 12816]
MADIEMEISIPTDNNGYVLLQCPFCGEYFKLTPDDYEDEGILDIFCPSCGLCGENFITEDVLELAMAMTKNVAMDMIYDAMKKWEKQFDSGLITFNAGKKPKPEPENPIQSGIEALTIIHLPCCQRTAKIKPMLKFTGCYCPFCGVKEYEPE